MRSRLFLFLLPALLACGESEAERIGRMGEKANRSLRLAKDLIEQYHHRTGDTLVSGDDFDREHFPNTVFTETNHPLLHATEFYAAFVWKGKVVDGVFVGHIEAIPRASGEPATLECRPDGGVRYRGPMAQSRMTSGQGASKRPSRGAR